PAPETADDSNSQGSRSRAGHAVLPARNEGLSRGRGVGGRRRCSPRTSSIACLDDPNEIAAATLRARATNEGGIEKVVQGVRGWSTICKKGVYPWKRLDDAHAVAGSHAWWCRFSCYFSPWCGTRKQSNRSRSRWFRPRMPSRAAFRTQRRR